MLFTLKAGNFYLEYSGEKDRAAVLATIKENLKPGQTVFLGVIDILNPKVETPEEIRDGFSPFADDTSTAREVAFAKIKARIDGTLLAESALNKTSVPV